MDFRGIGDFIIEGGNEMSKIIAKGKVNNEMMTIICEDMKFTFDGKTNEGFETLILDETDFLRPIGGTYYPKRNTMLAVKLVLEESFFNELIKIEVIGDIGTIPFEKNRIY